MISYIFALAILTIVLIANALGPEATGISINYFDSVLHLLGGIGLGFFFLGLTRVGSLRGWHTTAGISLIVFACGVAWEVFELYFSIAGYTPWTTLYYLDTAKDMLLDVVGAALVAHITVRRR